MQENYASEKQKYANASHAINPCVAKCKNRINPVFLATHAMQACTCESCIVSLVCDVCIDCLHCVHLSGNQALHWLSSSFLISFIIHRSNFRQ